MSYLKPLSKIMIYSLMAMSEKLNPREMRDLKKIEFNKRMQEEGETLQNFSQELCLLARDAYPEAGSAMVEELMLDQFLAGISKDKLRLLVGQARPKNLTEALHHALRVFSNRQY